MRLQLKTNAPAAALAAVALLLLCKLALTSAAAPDYAKEARPSFDALLGGHVSRFLSLAPVYGGSLILRAPFVLISKLWHGGALSTFRASAFPCLLAIGALAVWLAALMRDAGRSLLAVVIVILLVAINPMAINALQFGHPEELLGAALAIAAVMFAGRDRPLVSGVLLGLAIANKEWALLAVGPVLLALSRGRLRTMAATTVTAGAVLAPLFLGTHGGFGQSLSGATQTGSAFYPAQFWWFLSAHKTPVIYGPNLVLWRAAPSWVAHVAHPLIVALGVPLTTLCVALRARGHGRPAGEPLLLLVLLLFLRCALDPWDNGYYILPCLIALVSWEGLERDGPPVISVAMTLLAYLVIHVAHSNILFPADVQAALFLAAGLPVLAALGISVYAPDTGLRGCRSLLSRLDDRPSATPDMATAIR